MAVEIPENLTSRLLHGERDAFDDLVRLCHTPVYRLALRMLRDPDDAQEVAQESFLAAFVGIGGFQQRSNIRTWLLSITYRKAVDRLKKRTEDGHILSGVLEDDELWKIAHSVQDFTDWGANPEQVYSRNEISDRLAKAMGKLPAESSAVFELRDIQGMNSRETAEILGINEGAVRVRLHRVRQILMAEMQHLFGGRGDRS